MQKIVSRVFVIFIRDRKIKLFRGSISLHYSSERGWLERIFALV